ncbi:hypothetical protein EGI24_06180 [Lacihabitans sp. CS3-21]|nr:hypothetical protein [Lacihabitans sp. CS3-21]
MKKSSNFAMNPQVRVNKFSTLFSILILFLLNTLMSFGQSLGVSLDTEAPEVGKKIKVNYSGPIAKAGSKMFAIIYKSSRIDTDIKRILTKLENNSLSGEIILPDSTSFFVIKIENKNEIDNNNGKGYVFNIFQDSKPLKGTYFNQGYATYLNNNLFKGEVNFDTALELIEKEFQLNPELKEKNFPNYLQTLARVPDKKSEAIQIAKQKFDEIFESGNDERFSVLYSYIVAGNKISITDSLVTKMATKYPNGSASFNRKFSIFQDISFKNPDKAKGYYEEIKQLYPSLSVIQRRLLFAEMLWVFAKKNDFKNIEGIISEFLENEKTKEAQSYLAFNLNNIAWKFSQNDSTLSRAKMFAEKAIEARKNSDTLSIYFGNVLDTYASILYKFGHKEEALSNQRKAMELMNNNDPTINYHFIEYLVANKKIEEAIKISEDYIKGNVSNAKIDSIYKLISKETFITKEASNLTNAKIEAINSYKLSLKKGLTHIDAPDFELKDLSGNVVRLSDFLGKTVIIDFWATWCTPCIKAFPAMQTAMKELENQNVKFLFINTFESEIKRIEGENNLSQNIEKIIKSRKLENFHILFDSLIENINQTANDYHITSIPAKIIIDKNGNIRHRSSGFSSSESLIEELKTVVSIINE